jgi:predicted metallopeptidase
MRYEYAPEIHQKMTEIARKLKFEHVRLDSVACIRSFGTSSRGTIARCHALNKVMQKALGRSGFYVLEFLSERFDKMPEKEKIKTIIHEMMHIPKSFGGGFKHHDFVCERNVEKMYQKFLEAPDESQYKL